MIISKKQINWGGAGYQIWSWSGDSTGSLEFDLMDSANTWYSTGTYSGVNDVSDNSWHHVVATYDGSGNRSGMRIYVDGNSRGAGGPLAITNKSVTPTTSLSA